MPRIPVHLTRRRTAALGVVLAACAFGAAPSGHAIVAVGTPANDTLRLGTTNDSAWGNGGDDTIIDRGGRDYLNGGGGDDRILGDERDTIYGGGDDDAIVLTTAAGLAWRVDCGPGADSLVVQDAGGELEALIRARTTGCETISVTGAPPAGEGTGLDPEPPSEPPAPPADPGFPAFTDIRDAFERAALGPAWGSPVYPGAPAAPVTSSGRLQMPTDTWGSAYLATLRFGAAQEIAVRKVAAGSIGVGACVQDPGAAHDGYSLELDGNGALWLWRRDDGVDTELFRRFDAAGTVGIGDSLGLRVKNGAVEAWIKPYLGTWKLARRVADPAAERCSGFLAVSGYEGALDDLVGGGSTPTPVTAPPVDPTPEPAPAPGFALGVHTGARDIDYRATEVLKPSIVRVGGLDASMRRAEIQAIADAYAARGAKIVPLVDFNDGAPDDVTARNVGTWATVKGVAAIEYGNEPWLNAGWDYDQYARSFRAANDAVLAANPSMTLIAVGDSANRAHRPGLLVLQALQRAGVRPRAVQFHPYGPNYLQRLGDLRRDLADVGWSATEVWATEVGVATDDGRTLYQGSSPNNYGWNAAMTFTEAARTIRKIVTDLKDNGVARVMLYMGTDYAAHGATNARESYFGLTSSANGEKGALTAAARSLLAAYR